MKEKYLNSGRKKQKHKTRDRILASAQNLLAEGKEFTLEDVAKETDISRATIYRYFSNIDILASEAGLDLNTKTSNEILEDVREFNTKEAILEIQNYYNDLALENEPGFRKYLSATLNVPNDKKTRGARRKSTLELLFQKKGIQLSEDEKEKVSNIATVLMGIEALVVTKDVCRLNDQSSKDLLNWGLEHILNSVIAENKINAAQTSK